MMEIDKECKKYIIKLSDYEALVFFEWLAKFNETNVVDDDAEKKLLYDLECLLESCLEEPFEENYIDLLNMSKNKIINE